MDRLLYWLEQIDLAMGWLIIFQSRTAFQFWSRVMLFLLPSLLIGALYWVLSRLQKSVTTEVY